ncbi:PMT6 [Ecytonucleospora hepatopenaei]|uniref:Dolichyl-phosphate-mannose--protein mannosyltransferase n=1 Tax=Ecytonucleospora hepatopenaei TaxID=646526 RepID=A0A1W0E5Q0_9MICR|nr:PMT6 [Ecytonucleospora hepatopenaei]
MEITNSKQLATVCIFLLSFYVKTYGIHRNNGPIWDESHFGKFAFKYLTKKFYFDVHPPLGKLLSAFGGFISYQKSAKYDFEEYQKYPDEFDYVLDRSFHSFSGSFLPVFAFLIFDKFGLTLKNSFLGSSLFIFDNGFTMISRIIVLDPHMLSCMAAIAYFLCRYHFKGNNSSLILLGVFIGCTISIKWVGGLTMAWVGFYMLFDQTYYFTCLKMKDFLKQLAYKLTCLLFLPASIYVSLCVLHMKICHESTQDAYSFSREFNNSLSNTPFSNSYAKISYGNQVTLRFAKGYLHSHKDVFPEYLNELKFKDNEKRHQVTVYTHRDENNNFYFQKIGTDEPDFIKIEDEVALLHDKTRGYLKVDGSKSFSLDAKRVTAHENELTDDSVFIIKGIKNKQKGEYLQCLESFLLQHKKTGLFLTNSGHSLPSWGHLQKEVVCKKESESSQISIEENSHSNPEDNWVVKPQQRHILKNMLEYQIHMYNVNKSLSTNRELEPHLIESFPYEWFLLKKGIRLTDWSQYYKFYLLMNPFLLYSTSLYAIYSVIKIVKTVLDFKRDEFLKGKKENINILLKKELFVFYFCTVGFFIHYLVFFAIGRVLYLHHYFPSYFFLIIGLVIQLEKWKVLEFFTVISVCVFFVFSPLCYGIGNCGYLKYVQLLKSWNFLSE